MTAKAFQNRIWRFRRGPEPRILNRFRTPAFAEETVFRNSRAAPNHLQPRARRCSAALAILVAILSLVLSSPGLCQQPEEAGDPNAPLSELSSTIEKTIEVEKGSLERYREDLKNFENQKITIAAAANAHQIQLSTYGNLVLSSKPELGNLEKAWTDIRTLLSGLQEQIDEAMSKRANIAAESANTQQQRELIDWQIGELSKFPAGDSKASALMERAKVLQGILAEKATLQGKLQALYSSRITHLEELRKPFEKLSAKLEQRVEERKSGQLFDRRTSPLSTEAWRLLVEEANQLVGQIQWLFQPGFWAEEARQLWQMAGLVLISFVVMLGVFLWLLVRLRRGLAAVEAQPVREKLGAWHLLALRLIDRSLILTGVTVFVYFCSLLDVFSLSTPSIRLAAHLLVAALMTRWGKIAFSFWRQEGRLTPDSAGRLQRLVITVRYFAWAHLLLQWGLGASAGLLLVLRLAFELWLFGWLISFWRFMANREQTDQGTVNIRRLRYGRGAGKAVGYLIAGAALFLDMLGYGALSVHWMLSWGRSLTVALGWGVVFFLLREWDGYYRGKRASERDELLQDDYPIQWLMIRIGQLLWLVSIGVALILAWGGRHVVLAKIYSGLSHSLQIGSMTFSFIALIYAVLVLLATQAVARLWRWVFQTKFLNRSGMEVGLQDSITTITVYVIWMLGILIALHVFGLNTASLAVAFGALGIGLGFGLQNIFNNFISGIILLFERPIQVGDDVEVNGTWATVKKINVRSTVVQTYDNASLIIPNADFVSSQVTNWSFKDKRLRRNIIVGVAYGSDVALVRDTLLEIARKTPRVLKQPAPEVLFTDFGDSALIFRLRIWTDIDNMLKVETEIRFEIDRLFRERDIEISFPQRDLHIRSWQPEAKVSVQKPGAEREKRGRGAADDTEEKDG